MPSSFRDLYEDKPCLEDQQSLDEAHDIEQMLCDRYGDEEGTRRFELGGGGRCFPIVPRGTIPQPQPLPPWDGVRNSDLRRNSLSRQFGVK